MESNKSKNELFPVFFKLNQLSVLLVGGGYVANEKLRSILNNSPDCHLTIVAKEFSKEVLEFISKFKNVKHVIKSFDAEDVKGFNLIIGAIDDVEVSKQIQSAAKINCILCNLADKPELCDFYLGSIVSKGDVKIAISTNGKSPTLAKRLREIFTEALPDEISDVTIRLNNIREGISGDISEKIKVLDAITKTRIKKHSPWENLSPHFKAILISVSVIVIMLAGHLLFSYVPFQDIYTLTSNLYAGLDSNFVKYVLIGGIAQLIDGALGMAYGVSVTTFLLSIGIPAITPAVASASMHASEVFTTGASSLVYMRFRNINKKMFKLLLWPGIIGTIVGVFTVCYLGKEYFKILKPLVSFYTLILGVLIIAKAVNFKLKKSKTKRIQPIAALGGFLDSVGGGGWGPIVTASLIAGGRNLRYAIGTSHLAKFFIALTSTVTFFILIGIDHWPIIFGLVIGGMIVAPFSINLSTKIPTKPGLILVGIVVILVSLKTLLKAFL
jgi:siroheme synthase-like protein